MSTAAGITGIHHFSPTVTDVEASAEWYEKVFELVRLPGTSAHHGAEEGGYAVLLIDPKSGLLFGLHTHVANQGEKAEEARTGLDHIGFNVASHDELENWAKRLDELGVAHSGIIDVAEGIPYSVIVFRDPDNIQLELFTLAS